MKSGVVALIVTAGIVVAGGAIVGGVVVGNYNHAVALEEKVGENKSNIVVKKNEALGRISNSFTAADKEQAAYSTIVSEIAAARDRDIDNSTLTNLSTLVNVIVEAYPDRSTDLYSACVYTVNDCIHQIGSYQEVFNNSVRDYNTYVKKFPHNINLNITGYEVKTFTYLDFEIPENQYSI